MSESVYDLFGLAEEASPHDILRQCKAHCETWTLRNVRSKLRETMSQEAAAVAAETVFADGAAYLKTSAAMLLDPSARQCYDAWLNTKRNPTPETMALTRSRLLWFNQTNKNVHFSEKMLKTLGDASMKPPAPHVHTKKVIANPKCRMCRSNFDFNEDYLVLHCHCTTRVGHVGCLNDFAERVRHKCPVCRQTLLKRHQVSKYLFWNVKEKYKFIE